MCKFQSNLLLVSLENQGLGSQPQIPVVDHEFACTILMVQIAGIPVSIFLGLLITLKAGNAGATAEKRLCNSDEFRLAT